MSPELVPQSTPVWGEERSQEPNSRPEGNEVHKGARRTGAGVQLSSFCSQAESHSTRLGLASFLASGSFPGSMLDRNGKGELPVIVLETVK